MYKVENITLIFIQNFYNVLYGDIQSNERNFNEKTWVVYDRVRVVNGF